MSLKDKLQEDLKGALRRNDLNCKNAIRMVRAAIQNAEIDKGAELNDDEVINLIAKQIRQREESIEMFAKGGRQDLVDEERAQCRVLEQYVPKQLTREEIEPIARQVIAELGATGPAQMGVVMRELLARLKGKADGKLVNQVVKSLLVDKV